MPLHSNSHITLLLFSFLLLYACKQKKEQPPVSEETMSKVMLDIQLAESYSLGLGTDKDSVQKTDFNRNVDSLYSFYSSILNHYHLSYEDFKIAVDWYKNHPDRMDTLLSKSLEELNRQKAALGIMDRAAPEGIKEQAEQDTAATTPHTEIKE